LAGGNGGGGGAAVKWLSVTSGTLAVTVGAGGSGGGSNTNGSTGGTSSVASGTQSITTISATGGSGGLRSGLGATPGDGGLGSNGDLNYRGQIGGVSPFGGYPFSTTPGQYGGGGAGQFSTGITGAAGLIIFEW
jgi:hypothetical protein